MKILLFSLIPVISSLAGAAPVYHLQPDMSKMASPAVTEASGLAASPSDGNFLWMVNDSGGSNEVHLFDADGTARGAVTVTGAKNVDWEDLAAFREKGVSFLLIADTGDNASSRKEVKLHIIREPTLPLPGKSVSGKIPIERTIIFTFQDGPRDCEAVGVDAESKRIILISKRDKMPQVHVLPLHPSDRKVISTQRIGTTKVIALVPSFFPYRNQPTGLDISADGKMAAVVTYYGVFLFPHEEGESWAETFQKPPICLGSHMLAQAESVAISPRKDKIFCVSEGKNQPIAVFSLIHGNDVP